jgi:hypothetical protein
MAFRFETTCESVPQHKVHLLHDMDERAREVSYETVRRRLGTAELQVTFPDYIWGAGRKRGLRMKNDWAIRYYRSRYNGRVCYDVDHSSIDHIWVSTDGQDAERIA